LLDVIIRPEECADAPAICVVIVAAFENQPYSNHREHHIVDKLRENTALTVSLVAVRDAAVVGHIAFSPGTIDGKLYTGYGLGLLSVAPIHQRKGAGIRLVQAGLKLLEAGGANGCVVLGEADFYSRFGFVVRAAVSLHGFPAEYFLALPFLSDYPRGNVAYHDAFHNVVLARNHINLGS